MDIKVAVQHTSEPGGHILGYPQASASGLAFWSSVLTTLLAVAALAVGVTTPPRSGPYCANSCVMYPYADVAVFVPGDYLWMYPASLLVFAFVILMACIHQYARDDRKLFSQIGLLFAVISATAIATDYFVQLAVMQPSLLKGETEGLSLFPQYNPHGIFIALEDLGYVMMSVAFLCAGLVFVGRTALERGLGWIFIVSALAAIGALIGLSVNLDRTSNTGSK